MSASVPRILQSADAVPCGSLLRDADGLVTVRLVDGTGWQLCMPGETPLGVDQEADGTGWEWDRSCVRGSITIIAEGLTEAECRHLSGLSAADALVWCEARDKVATTSAKRPQPGDVVPWSEVEDGALYYVGETDRFRMALHGTTGVMSGPADPDIEVMLRGGYGGTTGADIAMAPNYPPAILVARYLGTDPEAWRKAMREWTANGNCPSNTLNPVGSTTAALRYEIKMIDERDAARRERDDARVGWAEQTADAARLRIALQEAQRRLVQAHEDIDTLIAKQTAVDFEIAALKQDRTWAQEGRQTMHILACGNELLAQHHARIVGRLLDEMARSYFVDRFLDPNLYADAMKAAGREVKP